MNQIIDYFSNMGITKQHSPSERRSIRMINQASVAAVLFTILFIIVNLYSGTSDTLFPSLIVIFLYSSVHLFNANKQHLLAKRFFVGISFFVTTIAVGISDLNSGMYYYFISVFSAGLMFFPQRHNFRKIIALTILCMSSSMLVSYFGLVPKLDLLNPLGLGIINIFILMFVSYVVIATLTKENSLFEKKTAELLENINERNIELETEKEKVEFTAEVLIETNAHLHKEVNERERVERSLRESNHTLQQFTYVASHDLKEPLRTIGSFSNLLERQLKDNLGEREREYLHFITDGVNRMSVLVDDLLSYATLNNPEHFEKVNLNNTIEIIRHNLSNLLERKKGSISFGELPILHANRTQLNQLFQNLISNGLKFNNNSHPQIQISCQEQETEYLFSVVDNGIGIPKEYQEKIWVIFQRLHNRDKFDGSGIGLSIAQKVVTNHGGRIWVESEENIGTTFHFTISKKLAPAPNEIAELQEKVGQEVGLN